jgi:hypothetical protein
MPTLRVNCGTGKQKDRPKAAFRSRWGIALNRVQRHLVLLSIRHEADASKAQDHHRPGGGPGDRGNREKRVGNQHLPGRGRVNAVPILIRVAIRADHRSVPI